MVVEVEGRSVLLPQHRLEVGDRRAAAGESRGGEHVQEAVQHRSRAPRLVRERLFGTDGVVQSGGGLPRHFGRGAGRDEAGQVGGIGDGVRYDATGSGLRPRAPVTQGGEQVAQVAAERYLDEGAEARRQRLQRGVGVWRAGRLQLDRVHDRSPCVRPVERAHERRVAVDVGAEQGAEAPGLAGARLRQLRVGLPDEVAQPRGGQDETAEQPRLRRLPPPGVLRDRAFHRQRGRGEEAGVVHEPLQQRPRGRRGHGCGWSDDVRYAASSIASASRLTGRGRKVSTMTASSFVPVAPIDSSVLPERAVRQPVGVERDRAPRCPCGS